MIALQRPPWGVYGQDWAVEHLRRGIAGDRIRHAYLLIGPEAVGKRTLARAFMSALVCTDPDPNARPCGECSVCRRVMSGNHPDVLLVEREEDDTAIKIEAMRALIGRLALKPYEGRYRFGLLPDFDKARPQTQDALLKTLEEPAPHAILILTARSIEAVLPTILSRSQVLHLRPAPIESVARALDGQPDLDTAALLAHLSGGRIGWALRAAADPETLTQRTAGLDLLETVLESGRIFRFDLASDLAKDKVALASLLTLWQSYWRDLFLITQDAPTTVANIDREDRLRTLARYLSADETLHALDATNVLLDRVERNVSLNLRLAIEVLFLDYPGLNY